ncbi:MAG: YbaB/EbfC family nucleoid-associated protein [Alphaproteobacteria bacterium]|nr:YbaB/EbfC family nucleoid-associated protein [Alphaproteobacteria bacterium]
MINFKEMMAQAQQMQFKLQELQEKLADIEIEAESGGGLVKITMACSGQVRNITIDPSIQSGDKETLEDLIVAAINNANMAKDERVESETKAMMKRLGLPEDGQLPF